LLTLRNLFFSMPAAPICPLQIAHSSSFPWTISSFAHSVGVKLSLQDASLDSPRFTKPYTALKLSAASPRQGWIISLSFSYHEASLLSLLLICDMSDRLLPILVLGISMTSCPIFLQVASTKQTRPTGPPPKGRDRSRVYWCLVLWLFFFFSCFFSFFFFLFFFFVWVWFFCVFIFFLLFFFF